MYVSIDEQTFAHRQGWSKRCVHWWTTTDRLKITERKHTRKTWELIPYNTE